MITPIVCRWKATVEDAKRQAEYSLWQTQAKAFSQNLIRAYEEKLSEQRETLARQALQIKHQQQDNGLMEEKIKQALVRGVCALNRHTLTVFQPGPLSEVAVKECESHGHTHDQKHINSVGQIDNGVQIPSEGNTMRVNSLSQPLYRRDQGKSGEVDYSEALGACLLPSVPHPASHYHDTPSKATNNPNRRSSSGRGGHDENNPHNPNLMPTPRRNTPLRTPRV